MAQENFAPAEFLSCLGSVLCVLCSFLFSLGKAHTGAWHAFAVSTDDQPLLPPLPESNAGGAYTDAHVTVVVNWLPRGKGYFQNA